ncbi:MAG: D-aminoacylase [Acidobacteriota bacterium]
MKRLLPVVLFLPSALLAADYDLLIRGARVVDGTGSPWFRADVGISAGRIAAVGSLGDASATRVIEARELVLAPGFIDVHTHLEDQVEKLPDAANYLRDGVTTLVTGNCGGSRTDLAAFFARLEELGLGPNIASLVGHNAVRRKVMGSENRRAEAHEIAAMRELVDRAMRDGAVGLSTGLIYVPGTYAGTEEVVALAEVVARHGGVYATHMRSEGVKIREAIEEAVRIGREARVPVEISHFKVASPRLWGRAEEMIGLVESARLDGIDVTVDQYPYEWSSTGLDTTLPSWARAGGNDALLGRLRDPAVREKIAREMADQLKKDGSRDFSYAVVALHEADHSIEGKSITEINRLRGRKRGVRHEIETILELMEKGGARMVFHKMSDGDVETILRYPNTAVASDGHIVEHGVGVPHPRSYGTNARVFAEYVRKRRILTVEEAVRRMTSLPARTFRMHDRGLIRPGFAADLVLFDPSRVADTATFTSPHHYSEGFALVLVNGVAVVEDDAVTGARPGRVLRHRD